jgi:hypothetical protein
MGIELSILVCVGRLVRDDDDEKRAPIPIHED